MLAMKKQKTKLKTTAKKTTKSKAIKPKITKTKEVKQTSKLKKQKVLNHKTTKTSKTKKQKILKTSLLNNVHAEPQDEVILLEKNIYLSNKELFNEIKIAKKRGQMTDRLARMLQLLCAKYAKKGNFVNYTYNDDMQAYAMMMLVRTWNSFNPEKSDNPFAFFTQCIKNSFIQYLNQEKRQRNIRDLMLIDQGMNPSFNFDEQNETDLHIVEDEEDFHLLQKTFKQHKKSLINFDDEDINGEDINDEDIVKDDVTFINNDSSLLISDDSLSENYESDTSF